MNAWDRRHWILTFVRFDHSHSPRQPRARTPRPRIDPSQIAVGENEIINQRVQCVIKKNWINCSLPRDHQRRDLESRRKDPFVRDQDTFQD